MSHLPSRFALDVVLRMRVDSDRIAFHGARGADLTRLTHAPSPARDQGLAEHAVEERADVGRFGSGRAGHVDNVRAVERAGE